MEIPQKKIFQRDGTKTYALVELVKGAPTTMVEKGPDDTVFSFPVLILLELLLGLGLGAVLVFMSLLRNAPLEDFANPNVTLTRPRRRGTLWDCRRCSNMVTRH